MANKEVVFPNKDKMVRTKGQIMGNFLCSHVTPREAVRVRQV